MTSRGCKSFADKTTLAFEPGISIIVGPNGSGKSNVIDAISWVLGEQGPRSLRGGRMEDVIFAGTQRRPALAMAEVGLTIDNTAGDLPLEFTEVTITRTLFRSREAEYRLNGLPCPLPGTRHGLSDGRVGRAGREARRGRCGPRGGGGGGAAGGGPGAARVAHPPGRSPAGACPARPRGGAQPVRRAGRYPRGRRPGPPRRACPGAGRGR